MPCVELEMLRRVDQADFCFRCVLSPFIFGMRLRFSYAMDEVAMTQGKWGALSLHSQSFW